MSNYGSRRQKPSDSYGFINIRFLAGYVDEDDVALAKIKEAELMRFRDKEEKKSSPPMSITSPRKTNAALTEEEGETATGEPTSPTTRNNEVLDDEEGLLFEFDDEELRPKSTPPSSAHHNSLSRTPLTDMPRGSSAPAALSAASLGFPRPLVPATPILASSSPNAASLYNLSQSVSLGSS